MVTDEEELAFAILGRMKEIEGNNHWEDEKFGLLWDAILDEIRAACPTLDYAAALKQEGKRSSAPRSLISPKGGSCNGQ